MRNVMTIDASGVHLLEEMAHEAKEGGYILVFSAVSKSVYEVMQNSGLVDRVGPERFAPDIFKALEIAENHMKEGQ